MKITKHFWKVGRKLHAYSGLPAMGVLRKAKVGVAPFTLPQGLQVYCTFCCAEIFGFFCASNISICIVVPGIRFTSHLFDNPYNEEVII